MSSAVAPPASKGTGMRSPPRPVRIRRTAIRYQLPVASPVSLGTIIRTAFGAGFSFAHDELIALLTREYRAERAVLCGSGTQALQLAITMAWRRTGMRGQVVLPAFACYDLATAVIGAQVPVSFYDVEPTRLSPDLATLELALRRGASVVVVAPLYGIPVDWPAITTLCARYGAVVIEDAAQGHGSLWEGQPLGSHGPLSVLSFGRGKGWNAGGGGALLLRGELFASAAVPPLALHADGGQLRRVMKLGAQWAIGRPTLYGVAHAVPGLRLGETVYHPPVEPRPMSNGCAATALRHHNLAWRHVAHRRRLADTWSRAIAELDTFREILLPEGGVSGYLRYPLLAPDGIGGFHPAWAAKRAGISPSYPQPLPQLPQLGRLVRSHAASWPGAQTLAASLITLPTHWQVSRDDRMRVLNLLRSYQTRGTAR